MKCPFCGHENTRVIDSRPAEDNNSIRRRRVCDGCDKRFTTYEKVETIPLIIIKKDNTREDKTRQRRIQPLRAYTTEYERIRPNTSVYERIIKNSLHLCEKLHKYAYLYIFGLWQRKRNNRHCRLRTNRQRRPKEKFCSQQSLRRALENFFEKN